MSFWPLVPFRPIFFTAITLFVFTPNNSFGNQVQYARVFVYEQYPTLEKEEFRLTSQSYWTRYWSELAVLPDHFETLNEIQISHLNHLQIESESACENYEALTILVHTMKRLRRAMNLQAIQSEQLWYGSSDPADTLKKLFDFLSAKNKEQNEQKEIIGILRKIETGFLSDEERLKILSQECVNTRALFHDGIERKKSWLNLVLKRISIRHELQFQGQMKTQIDQINAATHAIRNQTPQLQPVVPSFKPNEVKP